MKKYVKPSSEVIIHNDLVLLAGSIEKDDTPISGPEVGAKGINGLIVDDEDENF